MGIKNLVTKILLEKLKDKEFENSLMEHTSSENPEYDSMTPEEQSKYAASIVHNNGAGKHVSLVLGMVSKWSTENPSFDEIPLEEKIKNVIQIHKRLDQIKPDLKLTNPVVNNFLERHDGNHGSIKIVLNQLSDIKQLPLIPLLELLKYFGKFENALATKLKNSESDSKDIKAQELKLLFAQGGVNPTTEKVDVSKEMWYSDSGAIINEEGFRVYDINNQSEAIRMGYYYEEIYKRQAIRIYGLRSDGTSGGRQGCPAPWCTIWRSTGGNGTGYVQKSLYQHSPNKWQNYRKIDQVSIYFIIDESRDPMVDPEQPFDNSQPKYTPDELAKLNSSGKWFMASLMITKRGRYILSSMLNDGEETLDWAGVLRVFPKLDGHKELFVYQDFSGEEMEVVSENDKYDETQGSKLDIARQTPETQISWIINGGDIRKPRTWEYFTKDVRLAYIESIKRENISHKISSKELLMAMLSSEGFDKKINIKLEKIFPGETNGLAKLMHEFLKNQYDVEFTGKKNTTTIIYLNSKTNLAGIYDQKKANWVEVDGIKYDDRFGKTDFLGRLKDEEGKRYRIFEYVADNGDKFYVYVDDTGNPHNGYIMSLNMYKTLEDKFKVSPYKKDFDKEKNADIAEEI